jgi:transketolase
MRNRGSQKAADLLSELQAIASKIRNRILEMCIACGGHLASSFSCVEILTVLYYGGVLKINPLNPEMPDRDRFILSKGHAETALYAILSYKGFFPDSLLNTEYRRGECLLGGHPDRSIAGIEVTTGALGHGLGIAAGIALAAKMDSVENWHFVLMGDAECSEGSVWEAAMFAAKHKLNRLIVIVDRNHIGCTDFTENYTGLEPFTDKWQAFGWSVKKCNGHDMPSLKRTVEQAKNEKCKKPKVIIADTIQGKGISFIENDPIWHVRSLSTEQEISTARNEVKWHDYNCN